MYFIDSYLKSQAMRMYSSTLNRLVRYVGVAPKNYLRYLSDRRLAQAASSGRIVQPDQMSAIPIFNANDLANVLKEEAQMLKGFDLLGEQNV